MGKEEAVAKRLAARPEVAYALSIPVAYTLRTPDDPYFPLQWGLTKIGAPAAWEVSTGRSQIIIAIVDTGIDLSHPDLVSRIWTNPGEIPDNGRDDDGNGKVDDVHGWHFYTLESDYDSLAMEDANVQDDNGHGTHVAGIAAAATDNGVGIAGVSWGATVMPVKVLDQAGLGWMDDLARGVLYAAQNGARVINISAGDTQPFAPLQEAIAYARQRGVLTVCAAGNAGNPRPEDDGDNIYYPARYPEAMAVAATDSADQRATFSSQGSEVSVAAPGVDILSTYLGGIYQWGSGTSMAAPHVAGLAAILYSLHPEYGPTQIQRTIELAAHDVNAGTLPGKDSQLGWGRIDASRAVSQRVYWYQLPLCRG